MKKLFKNILYIFGIYFIFIIILSILNYIGLISNIVILYFNGNRECIRKCNNKILFSLLLGISIDVIFLIITLLLNKFNVKLILYYILIILVSVLSSFRKKKIA